MPRQRQSGQKGGEAGRDGGREGGKEGRRLFFDSPEEFQVNDDEGNPAKDEKGGILLVQGLKEGGREGGWERLASRTNDGIIDATGKLTL